MVLEFFFVFYVIISLQNDSSNCKIPLLFTHTQIIWLHNCELLSKVINIYNQFILYNYTEINLKAVYAMVTGF